MEKGITYLDTKFAKVLPPEGEIITDLDKLIYTMGQVALYSHEADLPHLRYGFHGYQQVTQEVTNRLHTGFFDDDRKMEQTMPKFARRGFDPLHKHIRGEDPGTWGLKYYSLLARQSLPGVAMTNFQDFHIEEDLGEALYETGTIPELHYNDYTKNINIVLSVVAANLMQQYVEVKAPYKYFGAGEAGLWLAKKRLFRSRDRAKTTFEMLRDAPNQTARDEIARQRRNYLEKHMLSENRPVNNIIKFTTRAPEDIWGIAEAA